MAITLQAYLVPEALIFGMDAETSEEVIRNLAGKLMYAGYVRGSFAEGVLTRERAQPTGLPLDGKYNAAIPHTDVDHVIKPGIAMATLARPVMFRNMVNPEEQVPVQLVFLLALDQPKSQIEMLQQVSHVLQNPELVEHLMNARNLFQVREALRKANAVSP
ncbi:MAG: PTS sugar transporter subunit IIA [Anaerolineae bacterium]|nr:MAG: PTS sugar transporter subunit IIA [Anaerolineae bacterium]